MRIDPSNDFRYREIRCRILADAGHDIDGRYQHAFRCSSSGTPLRRPREPLPLQARRNPDLAARQVDGTVAVAAALDTALREQEVTGMLRVQHESRPACDVQHHHILARRRRQADVCTLTPMRRDAHRLLDLPTRKPGG